MSRFCARPEDGSELCDQLRILRRSLTDLRIGQIGECLASWVPILDSYLTNRCPLRLKAGLSTLVHVMRQFEECWDNPEEELSSFFAIIAYLDHLLG